MTKSTWSSNPATAQWNDPDNWVPTQLPDSQAVFGPSAKTCIDFAEGGTQQVDSIEFSAAAAAYRFNFTSSTQPALTLTGAVINHSEQQQSFIVAATTSGYNNPQLSFTGTASAGGDTVFYSAGPESPAGYGGGVISFHQQACAGSARFTAWTGAAAPPDHSTVGGEIAFCDQSSAGQASFSIYGSLGSDGDTFGNVVFHDSATAAAASFRNVGGTVSGGDGGNTQFYGNSSAASGMFINLGGTHAKANGGDVAFDSQASGCCGIFQNHAAPAAGAYGGVTSFNNNPPKTSDGGASAGNGRYFNFGAQAGEEGGGGHLEFSAKYGAPTAANAQITNLGSVMSSRSSAGHTLFSISLPASYAPTAGRATICNQPAPLKGGAGGYTEFAVFGEGEAAGYPTAGKAVISNLGGSADGLAGGFTEFSGQCSAGAATLIALGGTGQKSGGRIIFYDQSEAASAFIQLQGNGELVIGDHDGPLSVKDLLLNGGLISIQLGTATTSLLVSGSLLLNGQCEFDFWQASDGGFAFNTPYTVLKSDSLTDAQIGCFSANSIEGVEPVFSLQDAELQVIYKK
ncbi:hypothetical protein [Marinobacterium lutimaris]|uniref:Uncharacterized protein n=1 Tax=Marinobacterium lutimaris TaxID=568106 RepID=A0A1H6AMC5_9GAMM|nr:hypothetical protein [Marinobacterium lutimaris]SEG49878.1 hypothetical protein SAMN05444390_102110 [Marinobacterium lutimaris]